MIPASVLEHIKSIRAGIIIHVGLVYSQANSAKSYVDEREKRRESKLVDSHVDWLITQTKNRALRMHLLAAKLGAPHAICGTGGHALPSTPEL
jgi:hypothetical protein